MAAIILPSPHEIVMREDDFIVSKTDHTGKLTYCNSVFIEFSGYKELELLNKPHNIVRHPDMPRAVFSLLWTTVASGEEFTGYIKNLCKDGSYYWVYATVTPSYRFGKNNDSSQINGYFSVHRKPDKARLSIVQNLYRDILAAEQKQRSRDAITAGLSVLNTAIGNTGKSYHEFIHTL